MKVSRRNFIKGSAAIGATSVAGLSSVKLAHAATTDYKAMVCIFLAGGNDSYNMVLPTSEAEYAQYQGIRNHMAIAEQDIIPLNIQTDNSVSLGLHPAMQSFADIVNQGDASVLVNTGQLVEPTAGNANVQLPEKLMSHNSQQEMWKSGALEFHNSFGWAGRMVEDMHLPGNLPPLLSLSSEQKWLRTENGAKQFVLSSNGAGQYKRMTTDKLNGMLRHMDESYDNIFMDSYAQVMKNSFNRNEALKEVLDDAPAIGEFPSSNLGRSLGTISKLIASRSHSLMGHNRQVFYVTLGGFDTHTGQLNAHNGLLATLSDAMAAFYSEMQRQGLSDNVTTFTMSDFGRRITPNASGTDHGWAGHQLVMGGAVKGGKAYGNWPDLTPGGAFDYNNGRVIPDTSADQVCASLAKWFGYTQPVESLFNSLNNFTDKTIDFI
ncbi:DUF1501 domain-containing protein [Thalassotalea sp. PLHSN55]|uniref:DUF1501 domain-containing protein n=1 Tax=Thalassotalea sp. PLHSN55 TaxID=3435888 RepID=UPI003F84F9CE